MSTMGDTQYRGRYHDTHEDIMSTVGEYLLLFEYPHGTHDIPYMYHNIPHGNQITKDGIPPRY